MLGSHFGSQYLNYDHILFSVLLIIWVHMSKPTMACAKAEINTTKLKMVKLLLKLQSHAVIFTLVRSCPL